MTTFCSLGHSALDTEVPSYSEPWPAGCGLGLPPPPGLSLLHQSAVDTQHSAVSSQCLPSSRSERSRRSFHEAIHTCLRSRRTNMFYYYVPLVNCSFVGVRNI
ncbi:unnamed protein product [Danaus chrysippus]|uniref:(African queen) hypothetical protein n=1 Tax=Danaus chrysippus TaxID=151541 RepID=A0A8J2RKQ5_9NEOP|nr:unnamed protein product [Danaus chrysippus]